MTGRNEVNAEHPDIDILPRTSNVDGSGKVALDVSKLGGMYANRIYIIGTEQGVGVRNSGDIGSGHGDIILSNTGKVENEGHINGNDVASLDTHEHNFNNIYGHIEANDKLTINTGGFDNTAGIINARDLVLKTHEFNNQEEGFLENIAYGLTPMDMVSIILMVFFTAL